MNANRSVLMLLLLSTAAVFQLAAQKTEIDQRSVAEIKAKAEAGDANSEYILGLCYDEGKGVAKDQVEAAKWYRKAAEQNHAKAQYNLGVRYDEGKGVEKDQVEAVKWFRKAAEQNHANAQYNLAACYYNGKGVAQNYVEAYMWWLLAARQGNEDAKNYMATLEKKMTPEQIAEGQRLARNFKAQIP
jgi:uncharacterized protein